MLTIHGTALPARDSLQRRTFLQAGGLSALGLTLPGLLAADSVTKPARTPRGSARSCILLYMLGGPPQQETFDPKPNAPGSARSLFGQIETTVPGMPICGLLPRLAQNAHRYAIVRSTHHGGNALFHGAGVHYNLTGWPCFPREGEPLLDRRDSPGIAAVLQQLEGATGSLPPAVQLPIWITQNGPGQEWAGQHAGYLGPKYDPMVMVYEGERVLPGTLPAGFFRRDDISPDRLQRRLDLLHRTETGPGLAMSAATRPVPATHRDWISAQTRALDVLGSGTAWKAFDIEGESAELRERYGDDTLGRSCLVARRLVEAGVRLVTVVFGGWDTHSHHVEHTRDLLLPPLDRSFAALLEDLDDRGLLAETLVAWTGEFGRTPAINGNSPPGRDHWARVYSTVFAGGGVVGGQVFGKSDNLAGEPVDNPVPVSDFVATIYDALGYDSETEVVDLLGRKHFVVAGRPIRALF